MPQWWKIAQWAGTVKLCVLERMNSYENKHAKKQMRKWHFTINLQIKFQHTLPPVSDTVIKKRKKKKTQTKKHFVSFRVYTGIRFTGLQIKWIACYLTGSALLVAAHVAPNAWQEFDDLTAVVLFPLWDLFLYCPDSLILHFLSPIFLSLPLFFQGQPNLEAGTCLVSVTMYPPMC